MFELHAQLVRDCRQLGRFKLSRLLLMNDANYPWFILVPERDGISEIYQLSTLDQQQLQIESSLLAKALMQAFSGDKLNIAALGNMVPQLHIHHIVRYKNDIAWPKPVWGQFASRPYNDDELLAVIDKISAALPQEVFSLTNQASVSSAN